MFIMEILVNITEAFLVSWLLRSVLSKRAHTKRTLYEILCIAAVISILNYLNLDYTVQIILVLCIHILYAFFCYSGSSMEKILWGSSYMVIASLSERIAFKTGILFQVEDLSIFLRYGLERYALVTIYLIISTLSVLVVSKISKPKIELPITYQVLSLVFVCCSLAGADLLSDILILAQKKGMEDVVMYTDIIFGIILIMIVSLVYLIRKISQIYNEKNALILERKKEEYLQKEYLSYKHMMEALRALKHDYSNHLQVLEGMVRETEMQRAKEYVDGLRRHMESETGGCNSGDPVLDIIISSKIDEARKYRIKVDSSIILLNALPLSETEITSLFGNLLDNAIEANKYVQESQRFIKLVIRPIQNDISIVIQNQYDGKLKTKAGKVLTRKEHGDHGIGIKQIEKIVSRANGYCLWEVEETIFTVTIILPAMSE